MPDGSTLENYYDAEYLRAGTVENGKARSFLYYNGELLTESKADTKVGNFLYDSKELLIESKVDNKIESKAELGTEDIVISRYILGYGVAVGWNQERKGYHSYHLDEQNSTAYLTDEAGAIQNSYQYGAFGDIRNQQANIHNRILYTGQQYDQASGQYYLRARFYNPVVGRFLQEDVYRGDGLNLYAYCANNPVMYYDPSGYDKQGDKLDNTNDKELSIDSQGSKKINVDNEVSKRTDVGNESNRKTDFYAGPEGIATSLDEYDAYIKNVKETELFLPDEYYQRLDDNIQNAIVARDREVARIQGLSKTQQSNVATVVAGVDIRTGDVYVGVKNSKLYKGNAVCAEDIVFRGLGGNINANIIMTPAIRPRNNEVIPVCIRCQTKYPQNQFVKGTTFQ